MFVLVRRLQELSLQTQKLTWVQVLIKMVLVTPKQSTIERHKEQNCFSEGIKAVRSRNPKVILGLSFIDDGIRDSNFFCDIQ